VSGLLAHLKQAAVGEVNRRPRPAQPAHAEVGLRRRQRVNAAGDRDAARR
jgi:hypothetical protein